MTEVSSPAQIQFVTPPELCLLRAALLEGPAAAKAAEKWLGLIQNDEAENGFRGLGSASRRLLPLVYRNCKAFLAPQVRDKLRLIHHEYWAANQKQLVHLQKLLPWFEANGTPTLVLKGMALTVLHYCDMALRPMADLDILVPEDAAPEVISRLQREGWLSEYYLPSAARRRYFFRHTHAIPLSHPEYGFVDLHWHVLAEATFKGADQTFWRDSVPLVINTMTTRALNPTDQIIHACVHGFPANVIASIRWIADTVIILRKSTVDWSRLVNLARDLHLTVPLSATLSFLRATFPTPIPEDVVRELSVIAVEPAERRYFETLVHHSANWREVLAYNLERHRRANRDRNSILSISTLPEQLQLHYNLPDLKDLGSFAVSRLRTRIRKRIGNS
jgi:putative nucleotidyltransferase-like protein